MLAAAPQHLFEEESDRNGLLAALFGTNLRVEKLPETCRISAAPSGFDFRPLTGGEVDESRRLQRRPSTPRRPADAPWPVPKETHL